MVDPFSVLGVFFSSMQFVLQFKTYIDGRKRKKQQELQQAQAQQQQPPQHFTHVQSYPLASTPFTSVVYYICTYHIQPSYYPAPYPPPQHLQLPPIYLHYHHPGAPTFLSRSLPTDANPSPRSHANAALASIVDSSPSYDWLGLLGGHMKLLHHQQAPHHVHETLGMRTGACAYNDRASSYGHWKSLQEEISSPNQGKQRSIAVVDWTEGNIDMFMEIGGAYFRNYRISRCDVVMFAHLFKGREVFSGEIKGQRLERMSREMKMVEIRGGAVKSTNSWMSLGIYEESAEMADVSRQQGLFIETVRGAVFGLVCCLYEVPHDLNVDMEASHFGYHHIVRINTHRQPCHIIKRNSCFFSVFSFGDLHGWASQAILLG